MNNNINNYSYSLGFNNTKSTTYQQELKHIIVGEHKYTIPKVEFIDITITDTNTEGTITDEQLTILQNADYNCIRVNNNEIYRLSDKDLTEGYLKYSYVSIENGINYIKTITITISTKGWVLTVSNISGGSSNNKFVHELYITDKGTMLYEVKANLIAITDSATPITIDTLASALYGSEQYNMCNGRAIKYDEVEHTTKSKGYIVTGVILNVSNIPQLQLFQPLSGASAIREEFLNITSEYFNIVDLTYPS